MKTKLNKAIKSIDVDNQHDDDTERRLLWSALNLLDVMVCISDSVGNLRWLNAGNNFPMISKFPDNLNLLGDMLGVKDLAEKLRACHNTYGVRIFSPASAEFELREEVQTGIITFRRTVTNRNDNNVHDHEAQALLKAMNENRICLFRQPVVDAINGNVKRYECLARMVREDGTIASPIEFIPAAERAGLISRFDLSTLGLALQSLKHDRNVELAVNVSAATIADGEARAKYIEYLYSDSDFANRLTIEITETIAIHDLEVAANFANSIKNTNARIALDDFGAGYTSFRSLKILPLDEVKIDGNYVEGINERKDNHAFVKAINGLAQDLGFETIAERVETNAEANALRKIGVSGLQGYLFGKPIMV